MTRMLRTPSRASAKAAVCPHMPPPMTSTSSAGRPSGPATGGTQLGGREKHALEIAPGLGCQSREASGAVVVLRGWGRHRIWTELRTIRDPQLVGLQRRQISGPDVCPLRVSRTVSSLRSTMSISPPAPGSLAGTT